VRDALLLAAGLDFDAVVTDESCSEACPDLWRQLEDSLPEALWIIHRDRSKVRNQKRRRLGPIPGPDCEILLALLLLALETKRGRARANAA
jgi:hypothetical protein